MRVLAEPTVVPIRGAIASGYIFAQHVLPELKVVCIRRQSNPRCGLGMLSLRCPVRGPGCALPGSVLAGTMVVLGLCVLAELPVRLAIASGCMCARRLLSEQRVVCVRR